MTEAALHQTSSVAAVTSQMHPTWRVDTQPVAATRSSPSAVKCASNVEFHDSVSINLFQNESRRIMVAKNSSYLTSVEKGNPFVDSDAAKDEFASSSDDYLSDKAEIVFSEETISPGIKWKTLNDSDEETSDGSDEIDEDTDENDKAEMSDTETKNLLDDVVEDEDESDLEDSKTLSSDIGYTSKCVQNKTSSESLSYSWYGMSDEQRMYYVKCFNHLMKKTLGHYDINGAICGANEHVIDFFKRSGLNCEKLSKIWSLSDVNEDGYLDVNEFSAAMHLIVLHVKGHIPIPDVIPFEISPPIMPRRDIMQTNTNEDNNKQSNEVQAVKVMQDWKQFDFDDAKAGTTSAHHLQQHHSFSDEHLHVQPDPIEKLSNFSDVPPLLVDVRPTARRPTQPLVNTVSTKTGSYYIPLARHDTAFTLSPQGPKGPPPKPPPRSANKGHGRSASLDLNNFAAETPRFKPSLAINEAQRTALHPQGTVRYHPCNSLPADVTRFSTVTEWQDTSSPRLPAPPLPPRLTFSDAAVQTENTTLLSRSFSDGQELIELDIDMEKRIEELLADENNASAENSTSPSTRHMNWRVRCNHLRIMNSHLEAELAKLAQIKLQLELRLQEAAGNQPSMKPTSL
ncbi:unnamed protein product [Thelazia callipaeda]|uniref:RalBP1-associated Eps domain-containing protein 2 n=1 Tax=Thelazia callipaeda TaxID=103827 RepID=A0A0N5DAM7_THECL|nr:unnamed protein product [Thelazia callipaeda]